MNTRKQHNGMKREARLRSLSPQWGTCAVCAQPLIFGNIEGCCGERCHRKAQRVRAAAQRALALNDQADTSFPVGAEQGAPRLRPGEGEG